MNGSSFSLCIHILTLLSHMKEDYVTSEFIAGSINIHPVMVRKEAAKLKKAGLVESKEGKSGGIRLARPADQITFREIFVAVKEEDTHTLTMYRNDPNPQCPIGAQIEERLMHLYEEIDRQVLDKLKNITLDNFHRQFA